jgi:hypothetical protein
MLRLISSLAFIVALVAPAQAAGIADLKESCSAQPIGTLMVDGSKASEAQMKAVRDEVQAFVDVAQDYISCVSLYANAQSKTLSASDKQKIVQILARVADEKEEVGCGFQRELNIYNKKHNLPGVEFDQICIDRFAREGKPAGTSETPAPAPKTP